MKPGVSNSMLFVLILFAYRIMSMFELICLLNFPVALANSLNCATLLEAKLKTTTKALEEADNKRAEEVASAKLAADQAVKEVEARAIKAKKNP
jgi:hypothetical protein